MLDRRLPERRPIKDVAKVIAVSSAKGGVGKSTVAANLALAFARLGHRSGILDTDIFGPSIPTLFNLNEAPRLSESEYVVGLECEGRERCPFGDFLVAFADVSPGGMIVVDNQLLPLSNYGVKTMSIGYLVGEEAPVVWRGLMVMKALRQLLVEVEWGGLDVLVLDLPPGTGDIPLSITQQIVLDGTLPPHPLLSSACRHRPAHMLCILYSRCVAAYRLGHSNNTTHPLCQRRRQGHQHV